MNNKFESTNLSLDDLKETFSVSQLKTIILSIIDKGIERSIIWKDLSKILYILLLTFEDKFKNKIKPPHHESLYEGLAFHKVMNFLNLMFRIEESYVNNVNLNEVEISLLNSMGHNLIIEALHCLKEALTEICDEEDRDMVDIIDSLEKNSYI